MAFKGTDWRKIAGSALFAGVVACSGGGGSDGGDSSPPPSGGGGSGGGGGTPPSSTAFTTEQSTARFLAQATFGPTPDDIETLTGTDAVDWFQAEIQKPVTLSEPIVQTLRQQTNGELDRGYYNNSSSNAFWITALTADDQLRQRVAFALSEIFVVSNSPMNLLWDFPDSVGYYHDILKRNAFGNYRDLLEEITYSPAMGFYLTYAGNEKADPESGRTPDENYAREILQLFSIGVVGLNRDGTVQPGAPETYTNADITGLAKVFTGLTFYEDLEAAFRSGDNFVEPINDLMSQPMEILEIIHSEAEKSFLGSTIPAGTPAAQSVDMALDTIADHPNVPPFISRQLIQRLVTSNPEPDYVERVAIAFEQGSYTLPDGSLVGDGRRGDLTATVAAILFDDDARGVTTINGDQFGKIREPIIRFSNWVRAFEVEQVTPQYVEIMWITSFNFALAQQAFRSPSVFNFFRPGYVAPGTESGAAGITVPELQITNASSVPGYINFMSYFVAHQIGDLDTAEINEFFFEQGVSGISPDTVRASFEPDYSDELALAGDIPALLDHLDTKLTYGQLTLGTRDAIAEVLQSLPVDPANGTQDDENVRVLFAVIMIVSSTDFIVQR